MPEFATCFNQVNLPLKSLKWHMLKWTWLHWVNSRVNRHFEFGAEVEVRILWSSRLSMGRRAREERAGSDYAGEDWSWKTFLEKLHFILDEGVEGDSVSWMDDGKHVVVRHGREGGIEARLGLRVCSLHQMLEAMNFECREELHWEFSIYRHDSFVRGSPGKVEEIISEAIRIVMPTVAYDPALKPLEVRLSLPEAHSHSWEVTVAPTVLPHPTVDDLVLFQRSFGVGVGESSWGDMLDDSEQWSDHDMNSPMWWSQHSDFSSICTDDLSDMDSLSQISAYYG
ncbi:unnamed protein product [Phytophthora lilii]|uniref:Unnamed protein product n=1 Tax=Phytophthora lilii TaxID=2077276 RepID=A0A9W6TGN3_9STRA|nr:unnamed protein product [Phytophthora lilii]